MSTTLLLCVAFKDIPNTYRFQQLIPLCIWSIKRYKSEMASSISRFDRSDLIFRATFFRKVLVDREPRSFTIVSTPSNRERHRVKALSMKRDGSSSVDVARLHVSSTVLISLFKSRRASNSFMTSVSTSLASPMNMAVLFMIANDTVASATTAETGSAMMLKD